MQNQNLGFNPDQVLIVEGPEAKEQTVFEKFEDSTNLFRIYRFRQLALSVPGVKEFTAVDGMPGGEFTYSLSTLSFEGNETGSLSKIMVDEGYIDVFEIPLLAGSFFELRHQEFENRIVISRSVVESLGLNDLEGIVGKVLKDNRGFDYTVVGVAEDYHHVSLKHARSPMIYSLYRPEEIPTFEYHSSYALKVETAGLNNTLPGLEAAYKEVFPANSFSTYFFNDFFNAQYQGDEKFGTVFGFFAALAIIIACLGLLGLIGFAADKRAKEIGIRKILGAKVSDIFALLSREFFILIALSGLIAIPFIWFGAKEWLNQYAFRVSLDSLLFLLPFVAVLGIALLSVSFQTLRAAKENPVDVLRDQ